MMRSLVMIKLIQMVSLGSFIVSMAAWGTQAVIAGEGRILATPDYVELEIQVDSRCYAQPGEARKANDKAAKNIVDFLKKKLKQDNYYNKVISLGGYTYPYQSYDQNKIVCPHTFQKSSRITFRTQEIDSFEVLFDEIQTQVYALFSRILPDKIESSATYVTLSTPIPKISDKKRAQLEQDVMNMALGEAKNKLVALFGLKDMYKLKVIQVSEFPMGAVMPTFGMRANSPMSLMGGQAEKSVSVPIQFDQEWISKTLYFTFEFEDLVIDLKK